MEFGSIFRSFGSEITIVEYLPRVVPNEDEDVSKELSRVFRKRGIDINVGAKVEKVEKTKTGVKVTFTASDGKKVEKEAEKVLVAVGRAPRTESIGLEKTKIEAERGFIKPMSGCRPRNRAFSRSATSLPDCRSWRTSARWPAWWSPQDRRQVCAADAPRSYSGLHLLRAADRQRGPDRSAGEGKGYTVKVGKFPFSANSKASIVDSHEGFVKVVADAKYGEILGVHIIGPQATELIAEAVTAMELEATVDEMMFTIHAHPTLAEAMLDGFGSVEGMAINV